MHVHINRIGGERNRPVASPSTGVIESSSVVHMTCFGTGAASMIILNLGRVSPFYVSVSGVDRLPPIPHALWYVMRCVAPS